MNQPIEYVKYNQIQRHDAREIIKEFKKIFQLNSNCCYSVMDIGCGPGDVLIDIIYPILPDTCSRVIGVDISSNMIQYANKRYANYANIDFKSLNIETGPIPKDCYQHIDRITSFYCLHWVQDQRKALTNIYDMLTQNGDCLLVFLASHPVFDAYQSLAKDPQWSEYMKNVDHVLPPLRKNPQPSLEYKNLFHDVGFAYQKFEIRDKTFTYEKTIEFKGYIRSIDPFIEGIPLHKREEYINMLYEHCKNFFSYEKLPHQEDYVFTASYKLIIAYAKKDINK